MENHNPLLQEQIHALVDGRLSSAERASLRAQLAGDGEALETVAQLQAQREALRGLHGELLDEPIPETLMAAARVGDTRRRQVDQWWRWGGMAAAVMLAFGIGWLSHGQLDRQGGKSATLAASAARPAQEFLRQASMAHAVYSPEVRHPVEVTAAQQDHLVQWLSKRLGRPLKVPVLAAQGYELVGGRLLPGDEGARAQFMFQNPAGLRLTLYLGAVDPKPAAPTAGTASAAKAPSPALPEKASTAETAFRYSADGPVPSFYWVDQGFGYALSGAVPRDELMKLAELVYQQL
ncbi:MAG: anti-sigma factor [Comamonadaceae bacterium]|nr:MAG: anti-sigma factor [Comamonadaceae bacterium]